MRWGTNGVFGIDEDRFRKKGDRSGRVARLYSGTALPDRELPDRRFLRLCPAAMARHLIDGGCICRRLGRRISRSSACRDSDDIVAFSTKPAIAREMIASALDSGLQCAFVLADSVYGSDYTLRRMLEDRGQPYVLAVRSNQHLRFLQADWGLIQTDPATIAAELPKKAWTALSAGEGAKGPRLYHWARVSLGWATPEGFERWLLIMSRGVV